MASALGPPPSPLPPASPSLRRPLRRFKCRNPLKPRSSLHRRRGGEGRGRVCGGYDWVAAIHRVSGRYIYTQRLKGANVNDKIILNKVLLVGTRTKAYIGQPVVTNAAVHAVVEEQGLDPKVIIFKYKKKKNYRRTIGHRQPNTRIKITGITGYQDFPAETMPETIPA
uniref:50S ribosomal protein L21, chloroplastic n=1 Tax=Ananas comosus var. bracteatus TaxID=296719 RepID=A0A6V7QGR7_ANACO|nr:unnamed protein product [Ananas comosus var. bracteatus]